MGQAFHVYFFYSDTSQWFTTGHPVDSGIIKCRGLKCLFWWTVLTPLEEPGGTQFPVWRLLWVESSLCSGKDTQQKSSWVRVSHSLLLTINIPSSDITQCVSFFFFLSEKLSRQLHYPPPGAYLRLDEAIHRTRVAQEAVNTRHECLES